MQRRWKRGGGQTRKATFLSHCKVWRKSVSALYSILQKSSEDIYQEITLLGFSAAEEERVVKGIQELGELVAWCRRGLEMKDRDMIEEMFVSPVWSRMYSLEKTLTAMSTAAATAATTSRNSKWDDFINALKYFVSYSGHACMNFLRKSVHERKLINDREVTERNRFSRVNIFPWQSAPRRYGAAVEMDSGSITLCIHGHGYVVQTSGKENAQFQREFNDKIFWHNPAPVEGCAIEGESKYYTRKLPAELRYLFRTARSEGFVGGDVYQRVITQTCERRHYAQTFQSARQPFFFYEHICDGVLVNILNLLSVLPQVLPQNRDVISLKKKTESLMQTYEHMTGDEVLRLDLDAALVESNEYLDAAYSLARKYDRENAIKFHAIRSVTNDLLLNVRTRNKLPMQCNSFYRMKRDKGISVIGLFLLDYTPLRNDVYEMDYPSIDDYVLNAKTGELDFARLFSDENEIQISTLVRTLLNEFGFRRVFLFDYSCNGMGDGADAGDMQPMYEVIEQEQRWKSNSHGFVPDAFAEVQSVLSGKRASSEKNAVTRKNRSYMSGVPSHRHEVKYAWQSSPV